MKYEAILSVFQPEIEETINQKRRDDLFRYVDAGGMSIDFAAKQAHTSVEDFRREMASHGYQVPELV